MRERMRVEGRLVSFVAWLVDTLGVSVSTAKKYKSNVFAAHEVVYGPMLPGSSMWLRRLFEGMERVIAPPSRRKRRPVRPQVLARAISQLLAPEDGDGELDAREKLNRVALLQFAFCGLLRAAEVSLGRRQTFVAERCLTRGDVTFYRRGGVLWARVMVRPCKKLKYLHGKTIPVDVCDGEVLTPVTALWELFEGDPAPAGEPLFRKSVQCPFTVEDVRRMVKVLMASQGLDPLEFGAHSLRIGGATALFKAGVSHVIIQVMGRWDSDAYEAYCRWEGRNVRRLGAVVASSTFEDVDGGYCDEELVAAPIGECRARAPERGRRAAEAGSGLSLGCRLVTCQSAPRVSSP